MAKYCFYISTGLEGEGSSRHEIIDIPDEVIADMNEGERDNFIHEYYFTAWLDSFASLGYDRYEEDE